MFNNIAKTLITLAIPTAVAGITYLIHRHDEKKRREEEAKLEEKRRIELEKREAELQAVKEKRESIMAGRDLSKEIVEVLENIDDEESVYKAKTVLEHYRLKVSDAETLDSLQHYIGIYTTYMHEFGSKSEKLRIACIRYAYDKLQDMREQTRLKEQAARDERLKKLEIEKETKHKQMQYNFDLSKIDKVTSVLGKDIIKTVTSAVAK